MPSIPKIPRPVRVGEYIPVYQPQPDVYQGEPTQSFTPGQTYQRWIPNDFSILRDGNTWHMVGITHPQPTGFTDDFHYEGNVHEAEFQLFHCTAEAENFGVLLRPGSFREGEKLLYPATRPGESKEIWAPHLLKREGKFEIVYSPGAMRVVATEDFVTFEMPRVLFRGKDGAARDPFIWAEDGVYHFLWLDGNGLWMRTSRDFVAWDEPKALYTPPFRGSCESPFLMQHEGYYYLFWCLHDGRNGCYDNRTFVFAAETLDGFEGTAPIAMLDAHAPEIVCDGGKYYILSVFYPENGISAAELAFV